MRLFKRVQRLFLIFARRGEDHPDHRLTGLDHGLVAVLQHLDLLHGPVAELPVQLCFRFALETFLFFLVHDPLLDCWSNHGNSGYSCIQRVFQPQGKLASSTAWPWPRPRRRRRV